LPAKTRAPVAPEKGDKRFNDPEWSSNQFYDFLKQAYLLSSRWANQLVNRRRRPRSARQAEGRVLYAADRQCVSPSNFVLTNPELMRETLLSNADNLVRGMRMLAEDIENGGGDLKIRQSDASMFAVGRNLATTPGKVIFQNELMQLIQYAPATATVLKRPLLIVPPWINKFYVLDLTPEKSFIKWCVDQGVTVFCISWVNPDAHLAKKALTTTCARARSPRSTHQASDRRGQGSHRGYCVGGTLLAITLAYGGARRRPHRIGDFFRRSGRFHLCWRPEGLRRRGADRVAREKNGRAGLSRSKSMATVFNMLRSNDLIWPYVINNYLKGKAPFPFDLLYWNSDATRMPAANHSFYLRNCYLDNKLSKGKMVVAGEKIDLKAVKIPIYNLATREDHIAPPKSVLLGCKFFGGPVKFVHGRLRPHRRRGQSAVQEQVSVLDRTQAAERRPQRLAGKSQGISGLMVARLAGLADPAKPDRSPRARPRRRRAESDRRRAGQLRARAGLKQLTETSRPDRAPLLPGSRA
jgi:polyhydroxyalkanoate synthase